MSTLIRSATIDDAAVIAEIYNQGIRGREATFDTVERSATDIAPWFSAHALSHFPVLAAVNDANLVVGWIHASPYRARACYAGVGDFSVYVAEAARGQRVGDALLGAYLDACASRGIWKLLSRIFPENMASRRLCARHGFREVGTYERHARLDGVWRDVVIVERLLPS